MRIVWSLRIVAAEHGVWSGVELARRMVDHGGRALSPPSISALMTRQPRELKLDTLASLCGALDCTPNDLLRLTPDDLPTAAMRHAFVRIGT